MMSINSMIQQSTMLRTNINESVKKINNGGMEQTTDNLFHKFNNARILNAKNSEIKAINNAQHKYAEFDNVFSNMTDILHKIKDELMMKKDIYTNESGINAINEQLEYLSTFFKQLLDSTSTGGEKMFGNASNLIVGDGLQVPKTLSAEFMKYNGVPVDEAIDSIINNENPNIDELENIMDLVQTRHSQIGSRAETLDSMKRFYENVSLTEQEYISKRYKLEEAISEFQNLTLNYEALNKITAKVASLSLVNYV